ncbi:MAG TPA: hypothetical protein VMU94_12590 [Streptosporangiaceae bacterium]|nr:hypothetical protein [Streptosporangiaceae bacterium]
MGIAIWCDVKDKGHAFDEREAIIVNPGDDALYFCQAHCIPAFFTAFHIARNGGQSGIFLPTMGGTFTVTPRSSQPAPTGQPDATAQRNAPPGGSTPEKGAPAAGASQPAPGKARPPRSDRSRESGQAIADLLEQEPHPGSRTPAPANYGGRA